MLRLMWPRVAQHHDRENVYQAVYANVLQESPVAMLRPLKDSVAAGYGYCKHTVLNQPAAVVTVQFVFVFF